MKNILFAALLSSASAFVVAPATAVAAPSQTTPSGQTPNTKEMKQIRKARKQNGPEVYKGTVAEQRRIVTDAPGAEKDDEATSDTPKKDRKMKKKG